MCQKSTFFTCTKKVDFSCILVISFSEYKKENKILLVSLCSQSLLGLSRTVWNIWNHLDGVLRFGPKWPQVKNLQNKLKMSFHDFFKSEITCNALLHVSWLIKRYLERCESLLGWTLCFRFFFAYSCVDVIFMYCVYVCYNDVLQCYAVVYATKC